jgi:hypothetical protein
MNYEDKVVLYKNRTLGERFSASAEFIRQNWKILVKNIVYIAVPLALISGYLTQSQVGNSLNTILSGGGLTSIGSMSGVLFQYLISGVLSLFLSSVTGAILYSHSKGELDENTSWSDLRDNIFTFAGRIFVQGLIIGLVLVIAIALMAFIVGDFIGSGIISGIIIVLLVVALIGVLIYIIPLMSLILFPIFFEDASPMEGIKKSIQLGKKNWANIFVTVLLVGLMNIIIAVVLIMPYQLLILFNTFTGATSEGILAYILAMLASFSPIITSPLSIIFLAFQYTAIVENEEAPSLHKRIDEFDNL